MNDPTFPLLVTGCRDCDRLTSGRCWRHSVTTFVVGTVTVIPTTIELVPTPPWAPLPND
jgi:hypothetical protein